MSAKAGGSLRSLALGVGLLVVVLGVRAGVGGPLVVDGPTLRPSVDPGAWVWVWKVHRPVEPGDAVWVAWPGTQQTGAYRVVATGPSVVEVSADGEVAIDGVAVPRAHDQGTWREVLGGATVPIIPGGPSQAAVQVAEGEVFVLSDARPVGGDSRVHGPIPRSAILGRIATLGGT